MLFKIYIVILLFIFILNRILFDILVVFNKIVVLIFEYDENYKVLNVIDGIKICFKGMLLVGLRYFVEFWFMIDLEDLFYI